MTIIVVVQQQTIAITVAIKIAVTIPIIMMLKEDNIAINKITTNGSHIGDNDNTTMTNNNTDSNNNDSTQEH